MGAITATSRYTNKCAGLSVEDEVSDDNTAETIVGTINTHMANLSTQITASIEANVTQIKTLLQQLATNNNQLNLQQQAILQQMAILSTNHLPETMARTYVPPAPLISSPPPFQDYQQKYQQMVLQPYQQHSYQQRGGGRGGGS
jgi:hypothetical protein